MNIDDQGDDVAGVVHEVGSNVTEFKPGDRVAAFHEMRTPHGSYGEYAIAWDHTTFHLPEKTSFEGNLSTCLTPSAPRTPSPSGPFVSCILIIKRPCSFVNDAYTQRARPSRSRL